MRNSLPYRAVLKEKVDPSNGNNVVIQKKTENGYEDVFEYNRNRSGELKCFSCFKQNDTWYALISRGYNHLDVLNLDKLEWIKIKKECKEILEEFCVTQVWVPAYKEFFYKPTENNPAEILIQVPEQEIVIPEKNKKIYSNHEIQFHNFGIINGCYWGMDYDNLQVQIVDLRNIEKGELKFITNENNEFPFNIDLAKGEHSDLLDNIFVDFERESLDEEKIIDLSINTPKRFYLNENFKMAESE